jgi:hypothetical protein
MASKAMIEGRAAWRRLKKENGNFDDWIAVGYALLEGKTLTLRGGRYSAAAFIEWSRVNRFDLPPEYRARLLSIMADLPAVERWRATLPPLRRSRCITPVAVWARYRKAREQTAALPDLGGDPPRSPATLREIP